MEAEISQRRQGLRHWQRNPTGSSSGLERPLEAGPHRRFERLMPRFGFAISPCFPRGYLDGLDRPCPHAGPLRCDSASAEAHGLIAGLESGAGAEAAAGSFQPWGLKRRTFHLRGSGRLHRAARPAGPRKLHTAAGAMTGRHRICASGCARRSTGSIRSGSASSWPCLLQGTKAHTDT